MNSNDNKGKQIDSSMIINSNNKIMVTTLITSRGDQADGHY